MILKGCPSCDKTEFVMVSLTKGGYFFIECDDCGVKGPHGSTETEARMLWNNMPRREDIEAAFRALNLDHSKASNKQRPWRFRIAQEA